MMMRVFLLGRLAVEVSCSALQLVQTSESTADRLSRKPDVTLSPKPAKGIKTIHVDPTKTLQKVEGFGGAITDSVAHVFSGLNSTLQKRAVDLLWGENGQQYNLGRLTIGATDFSTSMYSFAEPHDDYEMKQFTLEHDDKSGFIGLVQRAQAANPEIEWLSTPWSPPSWLKRNKDMRNSESPGLVQTKEAQTAYALYFSKYVSEMATRNITIRRVTVQNEPHVKGQFAATYPSCGFTGEQERDFLRDYLGPRLRADHPNLQIFVHDDQKSDKGRPFMMEWTTAIMNDTEAAKYVDGVAFHWYGDNLNNYEELRKVHALYPQLPLLATEATLEAPGSQHIATTPWEEAQKYAIDIIGDLNAWSTGWIEWNVLLDTSGGPTCIGPAHTGICTPVVGHCDAPLLADTKNQTLEIRDSFWFMGHFSRFIPRGSTVVSCSVEPHLNATAAVTPKGDVVVVVLNTNPADNKTYQLQLGSDQYATIEIPSHSIQTMVFSPPSPAMQLI
jgi:glucosylceramidase